MVKRIAAIVFIYICITIAWVILGTTVLWRTFQQEGPLQEAVGQLWGTAQRQQAPAVTHQIARLTGGGVLRAEPTTYPSELDASDIQVNLDLEYRRKGLLWYSTYRVSFGGAYRIVNDSGDYWRTTFQLNLPAPGAIYDDFRLAVDGTTVEDVAISSGALSYPIDLAPGQSTTVQVSYRSQGLDEWWYDFGPDVARVRNFTLTMNTNFGQIDFPAKDPSSEGGTSAMASSMSPTEKEPTAAGWKLTWRYTSLLSGRPIGMLMPHQLNPGPWASKIIYFAPVPLFLFFFLLFLFTTVRKIKIHPMNYFFIGAAFFSYHLLLAYLVDHISIHLAFWICSAISILLVVSYMRLVVGIRFALVEMGISQFVYLVLFSYTFFFEGYTGLVITVMCVITLFVIMQFTGRVDWETVFKKGEKAPGIGGQGLGTGLVQRTAAPGDQPSGQ